MGNEAKVEAILNGVKGKVRAHLDSESLQLSGKPRVILPLKRASAAAQGKWLVVRAGSTVIKLLLGASKAALWEKKISNPPSLATKLGLRSKAIIWLLGDPTPEILDSIREVTGETLSQAVKSKPIDLIFVAFQIAEDEKRFRLAKPFLNDTNALWVIFRKGPNGPGEENITTAGRRNGLRDTKVAKISSTHTGLRFVLPRT